MMDGRALLAAHRFDESVKAYESQLREGLGNEWANIGGIGRALMACERFAEAIPYLERIGTHEKATLKGAAGRDIPISVCKWLLGEREAALGLMREMVKGVRTGAIAYTDFAGGVSQGIMLCYMAKTLKREDDVALALEFLKERAKASRIKSWPGPAALVLLQRLSLSEAIQQLTGTADLARASQMAEEDILKRRRLTNALFAAAVERRLALDEMQCREHLRCCASLTNPELEFEWHLARAEVSGV